MDRRSFAYMLRYCMEPGFCEQDRLEKLLAFCRQTQTTDVMFFYNSEELNRGHYTPEELDLWLDLIARMKPILAQEGITTSINPWATVLHTDRGRTLRPGQDFTRMVDPYGNQASAVACPACERFLAYLANEYRSCAAKVQPNVLWIEDDFRLHNHHPLIWGGCFCDLHMALYSKAAGKTLTREAFVAGILAPGAVHPYRKIWLDTALATLHHMGETIRSAVMAVSPQTRLGLMTSDPAVHGAEGRDWNAIFTALKTEKNPYIRIHLPAYQEATAQNYGVGFTSVSRLVRHLTPDWAENYGELENFTFSRLSKSRRFSQMQIESNTLLDGKGITLDIYDMLGNGVLPCEGYQEILTESKPFLDTLVNLGLDNRRQSGVRVLVDPLSAYSLHTTGGRSMSELYARDRNLMQVLIPFGLASCYCSDSAQLRHDVVAVSGQYLRNLPEQAIRRLFSNNYLILDGEAVRTLVELNLGELAGAEAVAKIPMDNGVNAFEQVVDGQVYCDIEQARLTMQVGTGDFIRVRYRPGADVHAYTHAFSPFNIDNGPAMTLVDGHVFILPYENYGPALLSPFRRDILLKALAQAQGYRRPVWSQAPHITVIRYDLPDRVLFALVNFSGDEWEKPVLTCVDGLPAWSQAKLYARDCPEGVIAPLARSGNDLIIDRELPRIQMMVLELQTGLRQDSL